MEIILAGITSAALIIILALGRSQRQTRRRVKELEAELREERDLLEIVVNQRTRENLTAAQEKLERVYRLAEFGELAGGFFHDLASPLTDLALRLETLIALPRQTLDNINVYEPLNQASLTTKRLIEFNRAVLHQLQNPDIVCQFDLRREIERAKAVCSYKSVALGVPITLAYGPPFEIRAVPVKFYQVMVNLLINALDSYRVIPAVERRPIEILIKERAGRIICAVKDFGGGISPEVLPHIFDRQVTTKPAGQGLGLGLHSARRIIQGEMSGQISVTSQVGAGTTVAVSLPMTIAVKSEN